MRPPSGVVEVPQSATLSAVAQSQLQLSPPVVLALVAAVLAVGVAVALQRRDAPGSTSLTVLALGAGWWSFCYALELSSQTLGGALFFGRLAYLGIVVVPVAWFTFSLGYTGRGAFLTRRRLVGVAAPAAAMAVLAWTTLSTGLVWTAYELVPVERLSVSVLSVQYGPTFWLWTAYAYILTGVGTVLLISSLTNARLFRVQTAALVVAVSAPWVGNLAFLSGTSALDLTPVGFVVSALAVAGGIRRYSLFDVTPVTGVVARSELVERLPEAVVALGATGHIADLNPSAEAVLETTLDDAVGAPLETVAPSLAALVADAEAAGGEGTVDYVVTDPRRTYEVRVSSLRGDRAGGRLVTLRDVTERRRREREVAVLNRVLRHDLRNDVAVIESYARLLEANPDDEASLTGLVRRAGEMRDLIETVRSVERHLDADEPTHSTQNIVRVVRDRVAAVAHAYPEATIETDLPPDAWVHALDIVGSAVDNLIENAVEHNDSAHPHVWVSVTPTTVDGERYVDVSVADDGPPLPDDDRDVLVGTEPSLDEASGLGLWLVNWIVTDSGGTVSYEPNEPRGNVVRFRLRAPDGERYHGDEGSTDSLTTHRDERVTNRPNGSPANG